MMVKSLKETVQAAITLIVAGKYEELERMTGGKRMKSKDIATAIQGYGRMLVDPPLDTFNELDAIEIKDAVPPAWSIRVNMWSLEEGRSDLTLELTVKQSEHGYDLEVDDLHVL